MLKQLAARPSEVGGSRASSTAWASIVRATWCCMDGWLAGYKHFLSMLSAGCRSHTAGLWFCGLDPGAPGAAAPGRGVPSGTALGPDARRPCRADAPARFPRSRSVAPAGHAVAACTHWPALVFCRTIECGSTRLLAPARRATAAAALRKPETRAMPSAARPRCAAACRSSPSACSGCGREAVVPLSRASAK